MKRPLSWRHHLPHCMPRHTFSVWSARGGGYLLTVTRWCSGGLQARIERRRITDGGYDIAAEQRWSDHVAESAARTWCESWVERIVEVKQAGRRAARQMERAR